MSGVSFRFDVPDWPRVNKYKNPEFYHKNIEIGENKHVGTYLTGHGDHLLISYLIIVWLRNFQFLWSRVNTNLKTRILDVEMYKYKWKWMRIQIQGGFKMTTRIIYPQCV